MAERRVELLVRQFLRSSGGMGGSSSAICSSGPEPEMEWVSVAEDSVVTSAGVRMPRMIYGTAWKENRIGDGATARLVAQAIAVGFTGIDTACQPKHYHEPGVGDGLRQAFAAGVARDSLFIQTKFSRNQDAATIPYTADAPIATQVEESVAISLRNLGVDYVDSLVL